MARRRGLFTLCVWAAFVFRGALHSVMAPLWDGFDEPFHLAYVLFVAENGRPPGWTEPSFPAAIMRAIPALPTFLAEQPSHARWNEAPGFRTWRALAPQERARRREMARTFPWVPYEGPNYERQQAPLFYLLSAPVARLLRGASLPVTVVTLRLWCVLVASLAVPLTARFLRLALPARGVFFGLPLLLVPNTLFFVFRVTNDALAFTLAAAVSAALLLVARRPTGGRALALGVLVAAGIWTKLSLAPALPAALVAVLLARRRAGGRSPWIAAAACGLPLAVTVPLFLWNRAASGSFTGLIEATQVSAGPFAYLSALARIDLASWGALWAKTHLWAGGWGFLQPSGGTYAALFTGIGGTAALLAALGRGRGLAALRRSAPVLAFAGFFLLAMAFHVASMVVAASTHGGVPGAGGEGWYFDLLRPLEAVVLAALVGSVASRAGAGVVAIEGIAILGLDALGVLTCLVPFWAGVGAAASLSAGDLAAALDVGPLAVPHVVAAVLAGGVCVFYAGAVAAAARR